MSSFDENVASMRQVLDVFCIDMDKMSPEDFKKPHAIGTFTALKVLNENIEACNLFGRICSVDNVVHFKFNSMAVDLFNLYKL